MSDERDTRPIRKIQRTTTLVEDTNTGIGATFDEACAHALLKRQTAGYKGYACVVRHCMKLAKPESGSREVKHFVRLDTMEDPE